MKYITLLILLFSVVAFAQDTDQEKQQAMALKKSNNFVFEANEFMDDDNFISAEKEYRRAISEQPNSVAGTYNLGNSYYKKGNYEEALYRQQQAAKNATEKVDKHRAFHNIGNILMKNKQCKEAVEAYKNALRNDPSDDETRYNLGLAKECAEQQQDDQPDENQDKDKENQEENKDQKDQEDQNKDQQDQDNKDNQDDQKDQDKKDGEDKEDEGKPKDEQGKDEQKDQKPQPGKLSPQQIENLLEAMNNQEQKVQEKMNADKQKGVKVQTDKDW